MSGSGPPGAPPAGAEPAAPGSDRRLARRIDAARLLPFLGAALLLAPDLVLSGGPAAEGATAPWLAYLFAAWGVLIGLAAWLSRGLRGEARGPGEGA